MVDGCVLCMALMKGATMAFGRNGKGGMVACLAGIYPMELAAGV